MVEDDGRDAVLIYAGDFDPSGEEILRDFVERCDVWAKVEHIAVLPEQVDEMGLVINAGKDGDSRAAGFVQRHGGLYQVEVEAIAPDDLRSLYAAALATYWETSAYEDVRAWEDEDRKRLLESALRLEDDPGASDPG